MGYVVGLVLAGLAGLAVLAVALLAWGGGAAGVGGAGVWGGLAVVGGSVEPLGGGLARVALTLANTASEPALLQHVEVTCGATIALGRNRRPGLGCVLGC